MTRTQATRYLAKYLAATNPHANPDPDVWMGDAAGAIVLIEKAMKDFVWHPELETSK